MSVVASRMQDLVSGFSKIFQGDTPGPHSGRGRPPPAPTPACGRARGASALLLGPKPWSPSTFGCALAMRPFCQITLDTYIKIKR